MAKSTARVGIYVDGANLMRNGGYGMRYDVLREFASRDGAEALRLNVYVTFDGDRAQHDSAYKRSQIKYFSSLRDFGYKVIEKEVRWYTDDLGNRVGKANADLDMAVDTLLQSENLDRVLIATGDGDFVQVIRALQNRGCRVEAVAFDNVSAELRREVDLFVSGYLIPNLLPTAKPQPDRKEWGVVGSRVRGLCYNHLEEGYGFFRYMNRISPGLWITDTRNSASPYSSVFFHDSQLPRGFRTDLLPSRNVIFDFDLMPSDRHSGQSLQAENIEIAGMIR